MIAAREPADSDVDHLVGGGGPAGSTLALRLGAAGCRVTLVEKEAVAHHKVCGEFLSREALHYLHGVGIDPLALGAQAIGNVRISSGMKRVSAALPFEALSLSRRTLDEALLARAAQSCDVLRGVAVESLTAGGAKWIARLASGLTLRASAVFLATGKHDLRGFARPPGRQSDLAGFKMHWKLAPAKVESLRQVMDLYLFRDGYGGISLVEDSVANLCLVVRRSVLRELGGWPELLESILLDNRHLRELLEGAVPLASRPLAISPIPYGHLAAENDGLWRVGDQAAVIPSFTGDGMSIALHSASLAARMFLQGRSAADYTADLHAQLRGRMTFATCLSRAGVTRAGRSIALAVLPLAPVLLRWIAECTRIPSSSLVAGMEPGDRSEPEKLPC